MPLRAGGSVWPDKAASFRKGGGSRKDGLFLARAVWPNGMEVSCSVISECSCEVARVTLHPALTFHHGLAEDGIDVFAIVVTP